MNGEIGYVLSHYLNILNKLSVMRLNICLEISKLGYLWRIALLVVEIACGLGELKLVHGWLSLNMTVFIYIVYIWLFGSGKGMCSTYDYVFKYIAYV